MGNKSERRVFGTEVLSEIRRPGRVFVDALIAKGADPAPVQVVKSQLLLELSRHPLDTLAGERRSDGFYLDNLGDSKIVKEWEYEPEDGIVEIIGKSNRGDYFRLDNGTEWVPLSEPRALKIIEAACAPYGGQNGGDYSNECATVDDDKERREADLEEVRKRHPLTGETIGAPIGAFFKVAPPQFMVEFISKPIDDAEIDTLDEIEVREVDEMESDKEWSE